MAHPPTEDNFMSTTTAELIREFKDVMDTITRVNNTASLADLARRAADIWTELEKRGEV